MTDVLLPRVAAGEFGAMQECMRAYGGLIWRLVRRFASGDEDPEDLVQEVFTDLWRCAHRFDPDTFNVGREVLEITDGLRIGVYSATRSIVDAYRLRHLYGTEQALDALKRWLQLPGSQPSNLLSLAAHFPQAAGVIRNTLQILI